MMLQMLRSVTMKIGNSRSLVRLLSLYWQMKGLGQLGKGICTEGRIASCVPVVVQSREVTKQLGEKINKNVVLTVKLAVVVVRMHLILIRRAVMSLCGLAVYQKRPKIGVGSEGQMNLILPLYPNHGKGQERK
jgi:hypothetical protein